MKIDIIDERYYPVWVMDSECCYRCGCILDYFETELCTDCLHDAWYFEERDRYEVWDGDWDVPIEETGKP